MEVERHGRANLVRVSDFLAPLFTATVRQKTAPENPLCADAKLPSFCILHRKGLYANEENRNEPLSKPECPQQVSALMGGIRWYIVLCNGSEIE